jgi:hypothetical protein
LVKEGDGVYKLMDRGAFDRAEYSVEAAIGAQSN